MEIHPITNPTSKHSWEERARIQSIIPKLTRETLVVFDIDYTLFRSNSNLGTPEWCLHLIKEEEVKGTSREDSFKKWYPIWLKAQKFTKVVLIENDLPTLLEHINQCTVGYIALTSRHPHSRTITQQQLKKVRLNFKSKLTNKIALKSIFKYPALYNNGIIYANDLNEKSEVFMTWLKILINHFEIRKNIKRVIFIDDLEPNVIAMENAIKKINTDIEYIGIRYSAGDSYKAMFNPSLTAYQAKVLCSEYTDVEMKLLLDYGIDIATVSLP